MSLDTLGFLDSVHALPEQFVEAHRTAASAVPTEWPDLDRIKNTTVIGMGGSGISGDIVAAVGAPVLPVPITVSKHYELPSYVGADSLVFAMSYSGNTEETLSAYQQATDAGARVIAIGSGGRLSDLATANGQLWLKCPTGLMPRAALGALVVPMVVSLFRMGWLPEGHRWLKSTEQQLARRRDQCAAAVTGELNPAREVARKIGRSIPIMYGGGAIGAAAAYRWKCDINENAKAPAFASTMPELNHNEICGWGVHGDLTRQIVSIVQLRHAGEHPQVVRRFDATQALIEEAVAQIIEVQAEGDSPLAQIVDLMYFGEWVSCYLASDQGVDPGPVDTIMQLKGILAAG